MKFLTQLVLLIFLSSLMAPSAVAVSTQEDLDESDLPNYFLFETGTWWEYINTIEYATDYDIEQDVEIVETEEEATTRVEASPCEVYQCFEMAGESLAITYFIDEGDIYMDAIGSYNVDNVLVLSTDGVSDTVDPVWALLYGYESLSGIEHSVQCELDFTSSYEFEGYTGGLLENVCVFTFNDAAADLEVRYVRTDAYLENVGLIGTEVRKYEQDDWKYTSTALLSDTSIDFEELAEDQTDDEEVELTEEDDSNDEVDLADFVELGDTVWLEYEITTDDYINGLTSTQRFVERSWEQDGLTGYLEDNVYYVDSFNGEPLSETYVAMDLEGYSQTVQDEDYHAFGFDEAVWGEVESMSYSCEYDLGDEESYELESGDHEGQALRESCSFEIELEAGAELEMLVEADYIEGLGNTEWIARFYANNALLLQLETQLLSSSLLEESTFDDVSTIHDNYPAIDYLYDEGIVSGYEDGSFKPENTVNRAELLKILVEGQGITPDANTYKNCFPDVTTDWYAKYVCYAKEEGWVAGYPDGNFRPADTVNKVEALKMLLNSQNIESETPADKPFDDVATSDWFAKYVSAAQTLGILEEDGDTFSPDSDRTRAGIAEELYRLLTQL